MAGGLEFGVNTYYKWTSTWLHVHVLDTKDVAYLTQIQASATLVRHGPRCRDLTTLELKRNLSSNCEAFVAGHVIEDSQRVEWWG